MVILACATLATAQQLQVDSVLVDTVWNSDSSLCNNMGIAYQTRYSRDLYLSFKPMGGGTAKCYVAMSTDSAKTWAFPADSLIELDSGISSPVQCDVKCRVRLRVLGQDRPGVAFRVTAQQWQPVLSGNPQLVTMGLFSAITPGDSCHVNMQCTLDNASQGLGYATISKVWWDAFGTAGTWSDSTATLSYTWNTMVPTGASGQRRAMIAKARDANGLWSAPCTLTVQFVELTKSVTMLSIPAGTFQMGDTNAILLNQGSLSSPLHSVTLGAFTMSQTLVTQEQYLEVMDTNPSFSKSGKTYPVESVTWYDAALFCNALSKMAGTDTVYAFTSVTGTPGAGCTGLGNLNIDYTQNGYRLPTEAEYEYANRSGTKTDYYWGRNYPPMTSADTLAIDSNAVWFNDLPTTYDSAYQEQVTIWGTQPVATKKPNAFGLYDMSGNVWEWCNDWYASYSAGSQTDPTGATSGSYHVLRGGSYYEYFANIACNLCAAFRVSDGVPSSGSRNIGFRVVCGAR